MKKSLAICLLYFLAGAGGASAQVVDRVLSDPKLTEELLKKLISIQDAIVEDSQENRIRREVNDLKPSILEHLRWSGQRGYLLEVSAYVDSSNTVRFLGSPASCGSAATPADALTLHQANGAFRQGEINGLRFSGPKSYFIWITRHRTFFGGERVIEGVIPGELASGLWADTATLMASKAVVEQIKERRNAEAISNAVERAKAAMVDRRQQVILEQAHLRTQQYEARVEEINATLKKKLELLNRARSLANELRMLQGVVTLGTAIGRINALMDPGASINNLSSMPAAISWLTEYESAMANEAVRLQASLQSQQVLLQTERNTLEQSLINQGMPRNILY